MTSNEDQGTGGRGVGVRLPGLVQHGHGRTEVQDLLAAQIENCIDDWTVFFFRFVKYNGI